MAVQALQLPQLRGQLPTGHLRGQVPPQRGLRHQDRQHPEQRDGGAGATRTVDSHVKALRAKIGAERVRTVHGVGYALEAR